MGKEIKKCVIVSGAPENDLSYYNEFINDCYVICADSGYMKCEKLGIIPNLIVGDFDSSPEADLPCEIIKLQVRKDDSDTFHCVKIAVERGYNEISILGGIGSRFDHSYSNVLSLVYCLENNVKASLIDKNNKIMVADSPVTLKCGCYKFFSVFALFGKVEGLSIKGADYELDDYDLEPDDQLTQSNGFKDVDVNISFNTGKLLIILCND